MLTTTPTIPNQETTPAKELDSLRKKAEVRDGETEAEIVKEMANESAREKLENKDEELGQELHETPSTPQAHKPSQLDPASDKSQFLIEIENILADDLGDVYNNMDTQLKAEFKQKGEETAFKIEKLLKKTKIKFKKIVNLIKNWLKLVPGVNKYFLEQEAKIKTDKLLSLKSGNQ